MRPIDDAYAGRLSAAWPAVVRTREAAVREPTPDLGRRVGGRHPSLLRRLFYANAAVLLVAGVLLIVTPVTISAPVTLGELAIVAGALMAMLGATFLLLRRALLPLRELTALMRSVDPLDPGHRLTGASHADAEVATLADAFNAMLDRLEHERRGSVRRALAAQEEERSRIARELHDELGQELTAVAMQSERAAHGTPANSQTLEEIAEAIRQSIDHVRRIARRLRPEALDDLGLVNALISLCRRIGQHSGVRIQTELANQVPSISPETELVIYRVAQESLTNAVRHAQATNITLSLATVDDHITLLVRDDGRGIDAPLSDDTAGVSGMRERALLIGAQLRIRSRDGAGTEVQLDVPLH
jgi:two-component system, NarL family, sensor histidine kinase UhpB